MSVVDLRFGKCLQETRGAPVQTRGKVGKAFRSLIAGTIFSLGAVLALAPAPAMAAVYQFDLDTVASGDDPGGSAPWLIVTFADITGGISVTLETVGLVAGEYINDFYFFMNPLLDPVIEYDTGQKFVDYSFGVESKKLPGAARFDAVFDYENSNNPNKDPDRFIMGELSSYNLLHEHLTTANILFPSEHGYYVGAKLQGIPGGGSSSIVATTVTVIPLPPAALLFLTGLAGLGLVARRRRGRLGGAAAQWRERFGSGECGALPRDD